MSDTASSAGGGANGNSDIQRPVRPVPRRQRKLVVVVDNSPESKLALRFAARRASHLTGGAMVLFHCIRPGEFQHWMAVADRMREEAREEAELLLSDVSVEIEELSGITPEKVIAEGEPSDALHDFMRTCDHVFGLVLGVGSGKEPGPLVDYFTRERACEMPCPVFLIPGTMSMDEIDAIA